MSVPVYTETPIQIVATMRDRAFFMQNQHSGNDGSNGRTENLAGSCHDTVNCDAINTDICHEIHTCLEERAEVYKPQKR